MRFRPVPLDTGPLTWVDTRQGLESMRDKLKKLEKLLLTLSITVIDLSPDSYV